MDQFLRKYSSDTLNVCTYTGQRKSVVNQVDFIFSVVAMVPFRQQDGGTQHFLLVEKFVLGVVDTGIIENESRYISLNVLSKVGTLRAE